MTNPSNIETPNAKDHYWEIIVIGENANSRNRTFYSDEEPLPHWCAGSGNSSQVARFREAGTGAIITIKGPHIVKRMTKEEKPQGPEQKQP